MEFTQRISQHFGLDGKTEDDLFAFLVELENKVKTLTEAAKAISAQTTLLNEVKKGLEVEDDDQVMIALQTLQATKAAQSSDGDVDMTKFVPIETFKQVAAQVAEIQRDTHTQKVKAVLAAHSARIPPAMRAFCENFAQRDPEEFESFIKELPDLSGTPLTAEHRQQNQNPDAELHNVDADIVAAMVGGANQRRGLHAIRGGDK